MTAEQRLLATLGRLMAALGAVMLATATSAIVPGLETGTVDTVYAILAGAGTLLILLGIAFEMTARVTVQ